jgi:DNA helicase II / ATP-dependent DNA helicase PcrA
MRFIADFHIHSHYSVATSKALTPENLDFWARRKGIRVVGTGDVFHPGWYRDLEERLIPMENGLFSLKGDYRVDDDVLSSAASQPVGFILSGEISSIYKDRGKVRKVHNLILCPSFEAVKKIQQRLGAIGNISSDGRPILGIASRDLLEIALEADSDIVFVPAHIWTPWFSALGAKSGYDTIEECFGDLTEHIFAVETGLSSDPPMNWLCSFLDKYTLISNSDAHSPEKLGREANLFDAELSFPGIRAALRGDALDTFQGTIEFFPQEGKYHLDGHRKCGICWKPQETAQHGGMCPVCGKPVTVGVLNRVMQLADRTDYELRPRRDPYYSLTPLKNLIAEIKDVGPNSKEVNQHYEYLLQKGDTEFAILLDLSYAQIREIGDDVLLEGIKRLRNREVYIEEGYDGRFGQIKVFRPGEIRSISSQISFLERSFERPDRKGVIGPEKLDIPPRDAAESEAAENIVAPEVILNVVQEKAIDHYQGPCLILAGPGTGKTLTLTMRIARLISHWGVNPSSILAITFTNKAAEEMKRRATAALQDERTAREITINTFHSFGMSLLRTHAALFGRSTDFTVFGDDDKRFILSSSLGIKGREVSSVAERIRIEKGKMHLPEEQEDDELGKIFSAYEECLRSENAFDIDDLIVYPVRLLQDGGKPAEQVRERYTWICIDEYQDINAAQYQLVRHLAPHHDCNIFAIGDPDQAIYGFRGADNAFIRAFKDNYPSAAVYELKTSYRCTRTILNASDQVMRPQGSGNPLEGVKEGVSIDIQECPTSKSEAEFVARAIERLMGGVRFFSLDSEITDGSDEAEAPSFSDFGVLYRVSKMAPDIIKAMNDHGIPYQVVGEEPFYRQEPIATVIDLLRLMVVPSNEMLYRRLVEKGIKGLRESSLAEARKTGTVQSNEEYIRDIVVAYVPEIMGSHKDDIDRLISMATPFGSDIMSFLSFLQLGSAVDTYRTSAEQVTLMTLHAAKGLEFSYVFIVGCEDGLLPYALFGKQDIETEEERRLLYVGMTRAKKMLFLSHAKKRNLFGRSFALPISPFLRSIKEDLVKRAKTEMGEKRVKDRQLSLFS